jgi:hypothetical protein
MIDTIHVMKPFTPSLLAPVLALTLLAAACTTDEAATPAAESTSRPPATAGTLEPPGRTLPPAESTSLPPAQTVDLTPTPLDADDPLAKYLDRSVAVFGVRIVASGSVPADKLDHAANVMAQYLDNDADGQPDDPAVVAAMVRERATLIMAGSSDELDRSGIFESEALDGFFGQDLYADETGPDDGFDAALEEVLHLISNAGWAGAYPDVFDTAAGSDLGRAMDLARGGSFERPPTAYPAGAWYHYDDPTCDYDCMASEYFYWVLTTVLGAQSSSQRCVEINNEWEPCTPNLLESTDPAAWTLMTDGTYRLPTKLPDGNYQA